MKGKYLFFCVLVLASFILVLLITFGIVLVESNLPSPRLTEVVTASFLFLLIMWYRKSSKQTKKFRILPIMIGSFFALLCICIPLVWFFVDNSFRFTQIGYEKQREFSKEQTTYIPLVTTIFNKATKTNVRKDIDTTYGILLTNYIGRKPVYFIRLRNNKIEKLFQSGNIKYEVIDTNGEKMVRDMLLGKVPTIQYPQYTCCGGDDISWSEIPFFRLFVRERRYLKDFYSELETILLIKDKKGTILGAMVDLHGD